MARDPKRECENKSRRNADHLRKSEWKSLREDINTIYYKTLVY